MISVYLLLDSIWKSIGYSEKMFCAFSLFSIIFFAYKLYEYPFAVVLGKNSLKKLVVWDVLRNFASIS